MMSKPSNPERGSRPPPDSLPPDSRPAHDQSKRDDAKNSKATKFDGNPNPEGAERDAFKPKDDTPAFLEKKDGPRTGKA